MIYPQRDNRRKRRKVLVTTSVLGIVVACIVLLSASNPNFFTPFLHAAGKPIFEARGGVLGSVNNFWQFLHSKTVLVAENNELKEKVALSDAIALERDYYKYTNAHLLSKMGRKNNEAETTIARIISKPGFSPYDTMIIDVGTEEGVHVHDAVQADDAVLLGEIQEAYSHTSLVVLYSSPGKETPVLIGEKAIQAVALGKGGGNFEIKLPRNTEVQAEDMVALASSSVALFGKIKLVQTSPTDTFERALFTNAVDVHKIGFVMVIKK
jgi:cell shape-determining protein MreC